VSGQDLFGEVPAGAEKPVRGRGPKGGKHYVRPSGYAAAPGTGPAGKTCRDCTYYRNVCGGVRSFPKCFLRKPTWTHGRGSDILARSPACSRFHEGETTE
jgi:hypothetical protein